VTDFANATIEWGTTPDSITLLALLKQQLGITDIARDTELSMYLDMAGNAAERYIDNVIQLRDVKEYLSHERTPIALRYWPASNLTSVMLDGVEVVADYQEIVQDGLAWVLKSTSEYSVNYTFKQMIVTYSAGYEPLPADLGYALVTAGAAYEAQLVTGGPLQKEVVNGVGSLTYDTASSMSSSVGMLPSAVVAVLNAYRRIHV
jgi:hypothetical protein